MQLESIQLANVSTPVTAHTSERASNEESELEAGISGTPCTRLGRGLRHMETVLAARSKVLRLWSSLQTVLSKASYQP